MSFEGWWYNPKTNQASHVSEHWTEVRYNPTQFGLTDQEVTKIIGNKKFSPGDTSQEGARGKLLIAAMKNGWVRIRAWKGQYNVQLYGNAASKLPKVLGFLKQSGAGPYAPILLSDLATDFQQKYEEGMADVKKALKAGSIPDAGGKAVGSEASAMAGTKAKVGVPTSLSDKQQRQILRQRIGRQAGIPDPAVADNRLEEKKVDLWTSLTNVLV